jgi:hypothetical protein
MTREAADGVDEHRARIARDADPVVPERSPQTRLVEPQVADQRPHTQAHENRSRSDRAPIVRRAHCVSDFVQEAPCRCAGRQPERQPIGAGQRGAVACRGSLSTREGSAAPCQTRSRRSSPGRRRTRWPCKPTGKVPTKPVEKLVGAQTRSSNRIEPESPVKVLCTKAAARVTGRLATPYPDGTCTRWIAPASPCAWCGDPCIWNR